MKFGQTDQLTDADFTIPSDHPDTRQILKAQATKTKRFEVYVGCAKWNKKDLKNFYPRGVKDELEFYSRQFNSIELNATFYRLFPTDTFDRWQAAVPESFRFFPKLEKRISHTRRLKDVQALVDENLEHLSHLQNKMGMPFLQMPDNFKPQHFDRVTAFVENWPSEVPLAIELRHTGWHNDPAISDGLYSLFQAKGITNILVDTAGRRDLMHMRLTTPSAFIRWVGSNQPVSDRDRLDQWVERIARWKKAGLRQLFFFVHQNEERESPALAAHLIERLNQKIGTTLTVPQSLNA